MVFSLVVTCIGITVAVLCFVVFFVILDGQFVPIGQ